jgi:DNA-binding response OmpR family regulator
MKNILVIEDDPSMRRGLKDNFAFAGYAVVTAADGEEGLKEAMSRKADLIVLDVMLPKINGFELCKYLRDEGLDTPILMLTAKGQEEDVVLGLKTGADDYLTKPFGVRVLLARCEALLRRRGPDKPQSHTFGECHLDLPSRTFTRAGHAVKLSPKEYELLLFLVENDGKALSRDRIMDAVWGWESAVTPRSIDRFVTGLRAKIEPDHQNPTHLLTVREFGYKFVKDPGAEE